MPVIQGLDPSLQGILSTAFLIAIGIFTAWSHVHGKRQAATPPAKDAQEFAFAGQLADMGPVKHLVDKMGLLIEQQAISNSAMLQCATSLKVAADAYMAHLEEERSDAEKADLQAEVKRQVDEQLREQRSRNKRVSRSRTAP